MTEIETARLLLRRWRDEDPNPYARMCADPEVMRYLPATLSREESAEQMAGFVRHWEERGFGLWAASGEFRLYRTALVYHDDWPEGEANTRPRSGGARLTAASPPRARPVRYGFETLGLERIISVTLPEAASRRVMEKAGTGRGPWRGPDVVWYAIDRDAWGGLKC